MARKAGAAKAKPTLADRFWAKVDKSPGHGPQGDCWIWTGANDGRYGQISIKNRLVKAHLVGWELHNGRPFPEGMKGCHNCDFTFCVRGDHITPGTLAFNAQDAINKGRMLAPAQRGLPNHNASKTKCIRGHEFTPENTFKYQNGHRKCRACESVRRRKAPLECEAIKRAA